MRVAGPSLTFSLLLAAAPVFAQGGGYYDSVNPYNRYYMNQDRFDRYEYYPPPQGQTWQGPMRYGQGQQNYWQQPDQQWQMPYGSMQQGPQGGYSPRQAGMGQSAPGPVWFSTQGQIKSSLEASGFKNVTVLPQSFLIRATSPDGSRIVMQVSSDGLYGVVANPTDQAASSGAGGGTSSGSASGTGDKSSSAGGASATGEKSSSTGDTSASGDKSSSPGQTTTR